MKRIPASFALLIAAGNFASAEPQFLPILKSTFKIPAGSVADQAGCANCHAGPPVRNAFGKQVEKAMDDAHATMVSAQILQSIEDLDADGDGYKNGEELRAGYLPGDPKSHPASHGAAAPVDNSLAGLIPKHTFHPAVVHFPIALYVFGAVLDVLGVWKRESKFRDGAFWAYVGAALSLAIVVPTGLISCFRQGYSLTPGQPVFTHFLCAVTATIGILVTTAWLRRARPTSFAYWVLVLLTVSAISAAGYFGGEMVYG